MARPLAMASSAALAAAALTIRAAGRLSPGLGAAAALPLFMNTRPRMRMRPSDAPTMLTARRSTVPVPGLHGRGGEAVAYAWGPTDSPVLLVHGWGGRAAQYAPLVQAFHDAGIGAVAFDAPAHGESPGRGTYIVDFHAAIAELARRHGPFRAAVGHSFGAFATLIAVADGLETSRVAAISSTTDTAFMISSFARGVGLAPAAAEALRDRFARHILPREPRVFERYNAVDRAFPEDVPCLFVHDTADPIVPLAEAERIFEARKPNARLVTTTGLGHYRTVSAPAVVEAVTAFIADGTPGPSARP
ncbi:alpha/beta hydrolase [Sinomonas sp. P47F7]|uniref:alpha/beta hydrolase n=1 Tax=Sinomonas sp. P47F7 TaxID=3410987 RepID=UPI003BF4DAD5